MTKKVFVSGCYDMLHSGHVAFFKEAARFGDLYVGIGSDKTIYELKSRQTVCSEVERLYMVKAVRYVKDACINSGSGMMDFVESVDRVKPDVFVVNEDGDSEIKRTFCKERGIEYVVLKRVPEDGLTERSTTSIRNTVKSQLPYRLDLAGTWIDQPYVSKFSPGWALTISLEPTIEFVERCGMSTSTRNAARKIWPYQLPNYNSEMLAKLLFCFENEPNKNEHVSGAQDAIGICMPGLCRHYYNNNYWPEKIESCLDEDVLCWLEEHLCMMLMFPRRPGTTVVENSHLCEENVKELADAASRCWDAIMRKDLQGFAASFKASFEAQVRLFPGMMAEGVAEEIEKYKDKVLAWKMPGAGGGGYLAMVCEKPLEGSIRIKIRRRLE
ncbi:MAG: adenylyltransferase/cytidyltransferase family protein [Porphyromonadaceae bacterium]|uniref:adenylyltransferase/cytidyltransferase family protein n=1 Tax=Butyricimonas virosa TaxID=544645 RepID=UPI0026DC8490|nr:adenylyltransferase/cytidyltransferase family protein [Butyricimonas virosa]MBS5626355.1 adenylyltransferase/cytidyltransferase family protein [Porphyromonadaceae bacterium]